jgi:DNA-binding XRE family transcriptional regulator
MVDISNSGIGDILREMRENAGLTPAELAIKINCHKSHIYRLEKGEADPSLPLAKRWVLVTRPNLILLFKLLIPSEYLRTIRKLRGSSGKNGN